MYSCYIIAIITLIESLSDTAADVGCEQDSVSLVWAAAQVAVRYVAGR